MTTPIVNARPQSPVTADVLQAVRYYLTSRRGLLILAAVAAVAGLAFNWSWLVAVGIAPILISALPCAVMCGLGLCCSRLMGTSCRTEAAAPALPDQANTGSPNAATLHQPLVDLSPSARDPEHIEGR